MDRKFLTVLSVSLLFALVVSAVFYQVSVRTGRAWHGKQKQDVSDVLVAARELAVGGTIGSDDVKVARIPKSQAPSGGFQKPGQVLGRPVTSKILAGEPIVEGRLAERGSGFGLGPMIPVGMRAASVKVDAVVGVAGFVLPGMRVDVLVTLKSGALGAAKTTTVLQNILVLSAGEHLQPDASGKAVNVPVVTLAVTPEQAEMLMLSGSEGRIQLVLRNSADPGMGKTPGRELAELYGPPKAPAPAPRAGERPKQRKAQAPAVMPAPPPPPVTVAQDEIIVIRGTQKSVEVPGAGNAN